MKALVTGANGFTGSHVVKALIREGHEVVGLVRSTSDLSRLQGCAIELVRGDLNDIESLKTAMAGVDVVFHIAAYVELGIVDRALMEKVNVEGTRAVLHVARAARVQKLVYCSTIGVFGHTGERIVDESFQRQQADFSSAYDRTKYEAQQLVDRAAAEGLPVVSVLPSGIMGADDPHFLPVLEQYLKGRLKLWPGKARPTGIVHVEDVAEGMLLAARLGQPGERYILSAGELTLGEMFDFLERVTAIAAPREAPQWLIRWLGNSLEPVGRWLNWQPPLSRERITYIYDRCVRVDASLARQQLGWQPRPPIEILRELLNRAL